MTERDQEESVTMWVEHLRAGDPRAAGLLHDRYRAALLRSMRDRFPAAITATGDEDDLVQSVFCELWKSASAGKLNVVEDRQSFWWLLWTIARNKAVSRIRTTHAQKRGGQVVQFSQVENSQHDVEATVDLRSLPADIVEEFVDQQERLFQLLEGAEREVASYKLEGYDHPAIASKLGVTVRTVERKVAIIRGKWLRYQWANNDQGPEQE